MDSLRAVQDLRVSKPDKIASIDVVCRPDKRVGRGLKQIQEGWSLRTKRFRFETLIRGHSADQGSRPRT
jgi:hypothetical protein